MSGQYHLLRCPDCGSALSEEGDALVCQGAARHRHPVVGGVPRFVPGEHYASSFGRQWNRWNQVQLDSRNNTTLFEERFRRYICDPRLLPGKRVLDAGCGAGAFLDVVSRYADEVVGFDLSEAVLAAHANLSDRPNTLVVQGDIMSPPLEPAAFDLVFSIGVLQHTPDPRRAFESLTRFVKPGGMLGVWIYERTPWEWLKPRHIARVVTRRLEPDRAMRFVEIYAPRAVRARRSLKRLPGGRVLSKLVPVSDLEDYAGDPRAQLTAEQEREWTVMDTHDMLITWHDHPQTARTVARWFRDSGFIDLRHSLSEQVAMVGTRSG